MNEEEVIQLVKENDHAAITKFVEKYKPIVERLSFQVGVNPKDIADIVQDIFSTILQKMDRFRHEILSVRVYQITINTAKAYHRKQKREQKLMNQSYQEQKVSQRYGYYFDKQDHMMLHECMQGLNTNYKLPLILYYFHDKTYEEIATILKCKTSTVTTRMLHGKKLLKKSFEQTEAKGGYPHGRKTIG
ncbi:RNA polymerase sigma factor [Ornithinibacillus xuwenensis]|uniref:RNA polymerase sigma factor n=1 Tax=Ornithinibacillus xuwenensis TaxID=3144668 RepID=A0ABU9XJ60_9BACI